MIDDPQVVRRERRPVDEPTWGDPFVAFATLSDPTAVPVGSEAPDHPLMDGATPGSLVPPATGRGRRPLLVAALRPWFEPRPGELRGVIVLLAVALAASLALWFDAARRPTLDQYVPRLAADVGAVVGGGPGGPAGAAVLPGSGASASRPGSVDGTDGWGLGARDPVVHGPVVHVSGAVREPGIVTLPEGSRVADAITASGGAMPDARLDRLNLARRIDDGERIHVPRVGEDLPPPEGPASRGVLADGRIDLNAASQAELESLPGVGPARAQAIIAEREVRPFRVPGDLRRVPGIGEATFQRLAPLVAVR